MSPPRARQIDGNQNAIVDQLRQLGFSVCILSSVGKGVPDLLLGRYGKNWLIELKDEKQPPSKQRLTDDELNWHNKWHGQVALCNSLIDILNVCK
jgi:hypothetical protein